MAPLVPASLQARLTLIVVLLFLGSLWSFAFVLAERQETRLGKLLADQQFAAVRYVAEDVDNKLRLRIDALERVAATLPVALFHDRQALTELLKNQSILTTLFDAGVIVIRPDGQGAYANQPPVEAQRALRYDQMPAVRAVLATGRPAVGRPLMGPTAKRPVVAFAVPVAGGPGGPAAILAGITSIDARNFLDLVSKQQLEHGEELLVVAPEHGIFVTGSDPTYILKSLPARTPLLDKALAGFEGSSLTHSHDDIERLASIKRVSTAGWFVVARMPVATAFASVIELRRLIFGGAALISLVVGLLAASLIRNALAPLARAAAALDDISQGRAPLHPLPAGRADEVGRLVDSFNRLQERLQAESAALEAERTHLRTLINAMPDIVCFKDGEGRWLEANDFDLKLFQLEGVDYRGKKDSELAAYQDFYREAFLGCEASDELAWRAGGMSRGIEVIPRPDGQAMTFDIIKVPLFHPDGRRRGLVVVGRDITVAARAQQHLKLAASVFEHTHEGITITDAAGSIIDVNEAFTRITGYSRDEVIGRNPRLLKSGRQGPEFYAALWQSVSASGYWRGEIWNRRKNGEVYPELLTISAVRGDDGPASPVSHYVAVFADISVLKEHEQQLERIAHYDALTGIPNRVLLADRMRQAIAQSRRSGGQLAVCYLDLDGFKPVNDEYGHEAGDRLLVEVARRLRTCLRGGDTVARLGGDEFVLLLLGLDQAGECEAALRRVLDAVAQPFSVGGGAVAISASIGVTLHPRDAADADTLLRHADQAMYLAKQAGRNRYHLFDPEHDRRAQARHEAQGRIEAALRDGEFVLHYQPKVNMRLGRVVGAEALIRWQHPERGLLPPGEFLPAIEDTDLVADIGDWVMEAALAQMSAWRAEGLELAVSVNVAARHLQQDNFVPRLKALLARHADTPRGQLELEVLETAALEDMGRVSRIIDECRQLGVGFALDDFGTGYSSLTYFKALRADTLKIDQSFVRDMLRDPEDLAIVEGVIGLTRVFKRQVIAEGVETIDHGLLLMSMGCELAQGYGIARPMPAERLPEWVRSWVPDAAWMTAAGFQWARDDLPLVAAESDHGHWVDAVLAYLDGEAGSPPPADSRQCRFGQWYHGLGRASYGHLEEFMAIDDRHERIHALGGELAALCEAGRRDEARARLPELLALRDELLDDLRGLMARVMMGG